ncbi:MAG: thioredoxin family protein [Edaphobacter sp.]
MASSIRTSSLSANVLLGSTPSATILDCKSTTNDSAAASTVSPAPATPAAPAARQPVTPPPTVKKHLYSAEADPKADIAAVLKQATLEQKRVILSFGGDWCGDCQVLEIYLHQSPNQEIFDKNFLLVHVDIGRFDKNLDITRKYDIPLKKGVPALAVLDSNGKLIYSQQAAEFGDMRHMYPTSVTDFLNKWKA